MKTPITQQYKKNIARTTESFSFSPFRDKPFWIFDKELHKNTEGYARCQCCFNHIIGLPRKDGITKPIHPFQKIITDALTNERLNWIIKATGLGLTELVLRWMVYLAVSSKIYTGSTFCIVTGPNINIAKELIGRIRELFYERFPRFQPDIDNAQQIVINDVKFQAFPSNHLNAMRAIKDVKFIFLDEADFFRKGEQSNARNVSERYIGKSKARIVMVSTPNMPGGLYEKIEKESPSQYNKIKLDWTYGIDTMYDDIDIVRAKLSDSFEREYNLKYGYGVGNLVTEAEIQKCIEAGNALKSFTDYTPKSLGIDPSLGGDAAFAFVLSEMADAKVHIIKSWKFDKPSLETMIQFATDLMTQYNPRCYIDASFPSFIASVKAHIGEHEESFDRVQPVNFGVGGGVDLLYHTKWIVDEGMLAIDEQNNQDLIMQLRTARSNDKGSLDKSSDSYDLVDALMLNLVNYNEDQL